MNYPRILTRNAVRVYSLLQSCLTSICTWLKFGVKKKSKPSRKLWTIAHLLLKSFCNASAWLISFPQCTEDWLKQRLTASMIQGDFLLQNGPTMCSEFLMSWRGGEVVLPVGRGSESRILIPAPRTSSLGNTIWYCHTDACKPVGWSLQLGALFVNFGAMMVRFLYKWASFFCSVF